jgi:glycosyltransferase involved in cell wall biosynthesis
MDEELLSPVLFKLNINLGPYKKDQELSLNDLEPLLDIGKALQYEWIVPLDPKVDLSRFAVKEFKRSDGDKKILCLFDYACNTGFGTVSENIVSELKKHFGSNLKLMILAINYHGDSYFEDENTIVYSAKKIDPQFDPFGRNAILKELLEGQYDGVFIFQDVGVVTATKEGYALDLIMGQIKRGELMSLREKQAGQKTPKPKPFKSIYYFPVDCGLIDLQVKGLDFFDHLVTYTEFGREEVLKASPKLRMVDVIAHGNNPADFYHVTKNKRDAFRAEVFGEKYPGQKCIITNVNRNQPRKDLPATIFGFIEAKNNWPKDKLAKPFLYLHTNPVDPQGWDLQILMKQTDLVEGLDYMFPPKEMFEQGATKEYMNLVYNASDVFITTTSGEGWGLSITEAMATKTPVIATNYSSIPEIAGNGTRAWLLESLYPYVTTAGSMLRYQTDIYEVGEKIIEVALERKNNTQLYQDKIEKAYLYAQSLNWKFVCEDWANLFHDIFKTTYSK